MGKAESFIRTVSDFHMAAPHGCSTNYLIWTFEKDFIPVFFL